MRMRIGIFAITHGGTLLAKDLSEKIGATFIEKGRSKFSQKIKELWMEYDAFICIMASGIVVRSIAPLLKDKEVDPCIVVLDEKGKNVISLLSGHLGGGNNLTFQVAELIGANPVITTASDVLQLTALDLWAQKHDFTPPSRAELTALSARLVNQGKIHIHYPDTIFLPFSQLKDDKQIATGIFYTRDRKKATCILSHSTQHGIKAKVLPQFFPKDIVIGIGCNRNTPKEEFEAALSEILHMHALARESVLNLASIDLKNDEVGLLEFAKENNWSIDFFSRERINTVPNVEISNAAVQAVGAIGVAEPTSLLSARTGFLLIRKQKWKNITMAVAQTAQIQEAFFT